MSKQTYESKPKVAFVCVHNSCRSQMAEALGKLLASDVFESYSAGTKLKKQINPDAVRICLLYTSPSPRDGLLSRMPSSA